jgi:hypothetical protein
MEFWFMKGVFSFTEEPQDKGIAQKWRQWTTQAIAKGKQLRLKVMPKIKHGAEPKRKRLEMAMGTRNPKPDGFLPH